VQAYLAVILAGGAGRRLGGRAKPTLPVAGRPMVTGVLAAVPAALMRVVVGPPELEAALPAGVRLTQERPPGGGPVAALSAGLAEVSAAGLAGADGVRGAGAEDAAVVLLAADLPLLTTFAVERLVAALGDDSVDGAVYVDETGRPQWLCGVWRAAPLRRRLTEVAHSGPVVGRALREVFGPMRVAHVVAGAGEPPPWYDCDTPEQVRAAEELSGRVDRAGGGIVGAGSGRDDEEGGVRDAG
jgi:molybdenum cofactor guanylyltransferase